MSILTAITNSIRAFVFAIGDLICLLITPEPKDFSD